MKKRILLIAFILLIGVLAACQNNGDKEPVNKETFTVSFETSSSDYIYDQIVESGDKVTVPDRPTRNKYVFRYWYLDNKMIPYDFESEVTSNITLNAYWGAPDITLDGYNEFDFENLTTEFSVQDGKLNLYYEKDGNVPYVSIQDFFNLLTNFIDPELDIDFNESEEKLSIFYQYYSKDEDETYDLKLEVDLLSNLIIANDPGFFWAYIYETETNYGRNIEYLYDYELNETIGGSDLIYNLNEYNMDLVYFDNKVMAPFYLVNQLFAGSSYYNVYFNGDNLYGIYGQVSTNSADFIKMKESSKNRTDVPNDLILHNYDMLAFNLDYFYGLKEYKNLDDFYTILNSYFNLKSKDYRNSSSALAGFLLKDLDELHTSYLFPGYHAPRSYTPLTNSLADYGPHVVNWYNTALYAIDDVITAKWNIKNANSWAADDPRRPDYWFIDDNSAVISFDSFLTSDIEETKNWDDKAYQSIFDEVNILPEYNVGKRYFVFNQSSLDDDVSETLVWLDDNKNFVAEYTNLLEGNGFVHTEDSAKKYPDGYYLKTINDVDYMVIITVSEKYNLAYIGLTSTLPKSKDVSILLNADIDNLVNSDSAIYLEMMIEMLLNEKPNVKNIGLDLTFNTGGNVGALYRIVGLLTSKPFGVSSYDRSAKSYQTTYITTTYDSYDDYDFFLLTSYVTFSAANQLTTIFKQNNIGKIIGQRTGGGASSITPILLPDGTFFSMSSNNINCLRTSDGEYIINEGGIEPDFIIKQSELFDNNILANILNN